MRDRLKNIALIILGALLIISIGVGAFFFWQKDKILQRENQARVAAQNRIAELSRTVKENNRTWSRLAQEKDTDLDELRATNADLVVLIQEREQQITTLTQAMANLRPIRIIVRESNQSEPEPGRVRVDFDETHEDFWRIQGFTITNPPETQLTLSWTRPARFTIVTTQNPDLSWQTYIEHDIPGLEIDEIESRVNPISRPAEQIPWYHGIYIGVGGSVAVTGNSGTGYFEVGYDIGDLEIGIMGGGIAYPQGVDFSLGLAVRLNPFAL